MKYIIIGLGTFGSPLAEKLTAMGHEVIGIDANMDKVNLYKDRITHTICMDAADEGNISGLPYKDTDVIFVAFAKNLGANILASTLIKNLSPKRLISRALNPLHEKVLKAIGVDEIVVPEVESANKWSNMLCSNGIANSMDIDQNHQIISFIVPTAFQDDVEKFNTLLANNKIKILGSLHADSQTKSDESNDNKNWTFLSESSSGLKKDDTSRIILFGARQNIQSFLKVIAKAN